VNFTTYRQHLLHTCDFYLFEQSFVFFRYSRVEASVELKIGPVLYRGPFSVARRPAHWVPFADTSGLVAAIENAFSAPGETIPRSDYEQLVKDGNPVALELGLRSWKDVGRTAFLFNVEDYGKWLRVTRWPWRRGAFEGWHSWERVARGTPSRARALERLVLSVQKQFAPRGFEFTSTRGLVPEPRRAPWPRRATKREAARRG
jgi:hypothetical protein